MSELAPDRALPGLAVLKAALEGTVVVPGSPEYDALRTPVWVPFENVQPRAIVLCQTPEDVAETIAFARLVRAESVARSGGHCFAGRSSTPGILIDLRRMRSVSVRGQSSSRPCELARLTT